jgi:1-acyl-sn-glycerol-3-phosphate acyltransferase
MRRIFRVSFFLVSAILALTALLLLRIFGRRPRWQNAIYRAWRAGFLWALGIRIKSTGQPLNRPALLVANHRSYADVLFVESPLPVVFLSKVEVRSWPLVGWAARALDTVFVDRKNKDNRRAAREALRDRMLHGECPVVFPEGTTTAEGLLPLHPGMFVVAAEEGWPVVATALEYSDPTMAWVGDELFVPHLLRVLSHPKWTVHRSVSPPFFHSDPDVLMHLVQEWWNKELPKLRSEAHVLH